MSATLRTTRHRALNIASSEYDSQAAGNSGVVTGTALAVNGGASTLTLAAPIILLSVQPTNFSSTLTLYFMLFDAASLPANGTVPVRAPVALAPGQTAAIQLSDNNSEMKEGLPFFTGLVWAASTTPATLTVDTSSSTWVTMRTIPIGSATAS
jgi:hypothetical protein